MQFLDPAGLGGIDRQKPEQPLRILGDIIRNRPVIDPDPRQFRLPAEDRGLRLVRRGGPVVLVANRQVDLLPGTRTPRPAG